MGPMWILFLAGVCLIWYGYRVASSQLYPNGRPDGGRWPLRHILVSIPRWDVDRVVMMFGGVALQFGGYVLIISSVLG
jgi:hypothetical protein